MYSYMLNLYMKLQTLVKRMCPSPSGPWTSWAAGPHQLSWGRRKDARSSRSCEVIVVNHCPSFLDQNLKNYAGLWWFSKLGLAQKPWVTKLNWSNFGKPYMCCNWSWFQTSRGTSWSCFDIFQVQTRDDRDMDHAIMPKGVARAPGAWNFPATPPVGSIVWGIPPIYRWMEVSAESFRFFCTPLSQIPSTKLCTARAYRS